MVPHFAWMYTSVHSLPKDWGLSQRLLELSQKDTKAEIYNKTHRVWTSNNNTNKAAKMRQGVHVPFILIFSRHH